MCFTFFSQIGLVQVDLQNLVNQVANQRAANREFTRATAAKQEELDNFKAVLQKLQDRLNAMQNKGTSAAQRLQMLESITDAEEKTKVEVSKETVKINDLLYRAQQQLSKFKSEEKIILVS